MHGTPASVQRLINDLLSQDLDALSCDVIVCPPAVYLTKVIELVDAKFAVGSQNVSEFDQGAFTGEIAADMLLNIGCQYAIVGHSERRSLFHESSEQVAEKVKKLLATELTPILCVGETLAQREAGDTLSVVEQQLDAVVKACGIEAFESIIIAYEPVWAIGTGKTATPEQAQDVHFAIRQWLAERSAKVAEGVSILYGGSVNAGNATDLFSQPDIDGGLIGGASLKADDFYQICKSAG